MHQMWNDKHVQETFFVLTWIRNSIDGIGGRLSRILWIKLIKFTISTLPISSILKNKSKKSS